MPSNYTLVYFNSRGRAEISRFLFAASNTKFVDERIEFPDWPEAKKVSPQGTVPYLKVDGKHVIPQSLAIARYLAREFGFYAKSSLDAAKIDVFLDTTVDFFDKGAKAFFANDEATKKELIGELYNTHAPKFLDLMERSVCGFNGYLVGSSLSVADMYLYCVLEILQLIEKLDKYPKVQQACKRVTENKGIKAHMKTRPTTDF